MSGVLIYCQIWTKLRSPDHHVINFFTLPLRRSVPTTRAFASDESIRSSMYADAVQRPVRRKGFVRTPGPVASVTWSVRHKLRLLTVILGNPLSSRNLAMVNSGPTSNRDFPTRRGMLATLPPLRSRYPSLCSVRCPTRDLFCSRVRCYCKEHELMFLFQRLSSTPRTRSSACC